MRGCSLPLSQPERTTYQTALYDPVRNTKKRVRVRSCFLRRFPTKTWAHALFSSDAEEQLSCARTRPALFAVIVVYVGAWFVDHVDACL